MHGLERDSGFNKHMSKHVIAQRIVHSIVPNDALNQFNTR